MERGAGMAVGVNKYGNRNTVIDGISFDSSKEARRYTELRLMERAGKIKNLELQVPFELLPKCGKNRAVKYVADFVYIDENGKKIVEDVKGYRTEVYKLKKKMMLALLGIDITEV